MIVISLIFFGILSPLHGKQLDSTLPFELTFGSAINLIHTKTNTKLVITEASWMNGSGQSVVTLANPDAIENEDAALWVIKSAHHEKNKPSGYPLLCGTIIRFENSAMALNLHSHPINSPLSKNYEVSGFGNNGNGDPLDNWIIECPKEKYALEDKTIFYIKHNSTGGYLCAHENNKYDDYCHGITLSSSSFMDLRFTQKNCPRCPIIGHIEAAVYSGMKPDKRCQFKFSSGLLFQLSSESGISPDDEL